MDLKYYRDKIDEIDNELLRLFKERMSIAHQIALYKRMHDLPTLDPVREAEKLIKIGEKAGEDMRPYAHKLYEVLFELSRAYQDRIIP